jgi:ATP-dependent 26S proteasome regulatory subunit
MAEQFCPAQQQAFDHLLELMPLGNVFVLYGDTGAGKSTLLREIHHGVGGAFLNMADFLDAMREHHPLALEEAFEDMLLEALSMHPAVIVDDFHLLYDVVCCNHMYQRRGFLEAPLQTLCTYAQERQKKLIFGNHGATPTPVRQRSFAASIDEFKLADYEFLCGLFLGSEAASRLDFKKIFRFAPKLTAHQLKGSCAWFKAQQGVDTIGFIDYLRSRHLASNVDLGEVEAVDLRDLKGVDDVIQSLEANIVLPLENDELSAEFNLKPKRGVLLAGPPGTGKTTVGRALAHRLKSKFFLVDGTFIAGTRNFYGRIRDVFEAAKRNAPSIIFIDDSDAIFESGEELGLYRYLLTMLDGLESESVGRVCVMMTAMNVGHLPPALIRSGRIELWLEMHLPDEEARTSILSENLAELPASLADANLHRLVAATEGFTGADLKRLVEDGKTLYAYDKAQERPPKHSTDYFLAAVETVRANKELYAEAEAQARQQRPTRPAWYSYMESVVEDMD